VAKLHYGGICVSESVVLDSFKSQRL
jgi:hypothetical protein